MDLEDVLDTVADRRADVVLLGMRVVGVVQNPERRMVDPPRQLGALLHRVQQTPSWRLGTRP